MEKDQIEALYQAVELVQKSGSLSLKDANKIFAAVEKLKETGNDEECIGILIDCVLLGQMKSPFSLRDASILYSIIASYQAKKKN